MKELDSDLPINHPYTCEGRPYKVYEIGTFEESQTCDELYFRKQIYYWGEYKIGGERGKCMYSKPSSTGEFDTEKLARNSIMLTDSLSRENPAQGIKVRRGSSDTYQNLWSSSVDIVKVPWHINAGFLTKNSGSDWFHIKFGDPDRSALIWGMVFMRQQVETLTGNLVSGLSYKYYKDIERGAYGATDNRSPTDLTSTSKSYSISLADIDENGLHYFKDDQQNPIIVTASEFHIEFTFTGYLNFDLLGSIYDFQMASTGADDWDTQQMGAFWVKDGTGNAETDIATTSVTYAQSVCHNRCKPSAKNAYYGLKTFASGYKCKCFELTLEGVIAKVYLKLLKT